MILKSKGKGNYFFFILTENMLNFHELLSCEIHGCFQMGAFEVIIKAEGSSTCMHSMQGHPGVGNDLKFFRFVCLDVLLFTFIC